MCDTIIASAENTAEKILLFGKNSDRQRNEAQALESFPRASHAVDSAVACTYINVPQVARTYAVLLCRPFWIWGAEMGANEYGVVIGNEGLFARSPLPTENALTGMDLLRLALERASTAADAVKVITTLLERHGQGGNCGHLTPSYYHNSFMIADSTDAFVLETVGREWLVERVIGTRAISNEYSIEKTTSSSSAGLPALLRDFGWNPSTAPNYSELISDPQRAHVGSARVRRARAASLLRSQEPLVNVATMMRILRDHDTGDECGVQWDPRTASRYSLCMHAGPEDRGAQTTGAMVSEIRRNNSVHWVTGTAAPCISIFKPVLVGLQLPAHGPRPTDWFDVNALWWRHERLHRTALRANFPNFLHEVHQERDALEARFKGLVKAVLEGGSKQEQARVIDTCWREAMEAEVRWYSRLPAATSGEDTPYTAAWARMDRIAGMPDTSSR
jgi:secernin